MPRGLENLRRSGTSFSDQIWLGIRHYPSLNAAADSISCVGGFEAVTAARLRRWIEKGHDELGLKVCRLLTLKPGAVVLGEEKHLQFQLEEALRYLNTDPIDDFSLKQARMRIEWALGDCKRRIRTIHYQNRANR